MLFQCTCKLHAQQAIAIGEVARDGVGRQTTSRQHDVAEVQRGVVHVAQKPCSFARHRFVVLPELVGGLEPGQAAQVALDERVDKRMFCVVGVAQLLF